MFVVNTTSINFRCPLVASSKALLAIFLVVGPMLPLAAVAQEICNNGIDDDSDSLVDCLDDDCSSDASCSCIQEKEHLLAPWGGELPWGTATVQSVAIDGDLLVVGVIHGDGAGVRTGNALVYRRDPDTGDFGPEPMQTIFSSLPGFGKNDRFGCSVAIECGVIVVGAYNAHEGGEGYAGSAHIFRLQDVAGQEEWVEEQELTAPGPTGGGWFGKDVAISGGVIVVGAPNMGGFFTNGAAFIYSHLPDDSQLEDPTPWKLQQEISNQEQWKPGDTPHSQLGCSVAISGSVIVLGANRFNTHLSFEYGVFNTGIVFVYEPDETGDWALEAEFLPEDLTWQGEVFPSPTLFGTSVSVSGDSIVVGANTGNAYVFERDSVTGEWPSVETQRLFQETNPQFGLEVSIREDTIVACSLQDNVQGWESGSAFLFRKDSSALVGEQWVENEELCGSTVAAEYQFGISAALSDDTVVIASAGDDVNPDLATGSAWVFELDPPFQPVECDVEVIGAWCQGSDGISVALEISNPSGTEAHRVLLPDPTESPDGTVVTFSPTEIVIDPPLANGATTVVEVAISGNPQGDEVQIPLSLLHDKGDGTSFLVCNPGVLVSLADVIDQSHPVIVCPPEQFVNIYPSGQWQFGYSYKKAKLKDYTGPEFTVVTDECSGVVEVTQSPPPGQLFSYGNTVEVTLTATDGGDNTVECSFPVNFVAKTKLPWQFSFVRRYMFRRATPAKVPAPRSKQIP